MADREKSRLAPGEKPTGGARPLDKVDEASAESFPASDSPSFTPITRPGAPRRPAGSEPAREPAEPEESGEDPPDL